MLCYIPREYMYLDILHVFYTYPKPVQDTFWDTHQIHQDTCICSLPMCHTGYTTGYIKIHKDTCILDSLSNNTSKYNRIQNHDTCILDAGYMRDTCICKGDQDTCGIHPRYMMRYMYLKCIQREMYLIWRRHAGYMRDTCEIHVSSEVIKIHAGYMRNTCGIHAGHVSRVFGVSKRGRK